MAKTIVVGGGASGMLAAAVAAARGCETVLVEKNEKLGKKLFITGKGRCNVTNAAERDEFFDNIPRNPRFLYSAFSSFDNRDMTELLSELGVRTKVERGKRVFPESDKSSDVLRALSGYVTRCGVDVRLNSRAVALMVRDGAVVGVKLHGDMLYADSVIIATGGVSYPSTGSTGDGYAFAKFAGHSVNDPLPSLIPLVTVEEWPKMLAGLTLKNVTLRAFNGKKKVYEELGELLFTHFGVSGPLVLSASARLTPLTNAAIEIDMKPGLTKEQLDARVLRDFSQAQNKRAENALNELLPQRLIAPVLEMAGIDPYKAVNSITKAERGRLVETLKGIRLNIEGTRPIEEAIITRGGVKVSEIDPSTMESKLVRGLYFCGEVLDVDAFTGGFNLQIAFSTGHLAGSAVPV